MDPAAAAAASKLPAPLAMHTPQPSGATTAVAHSPEPSSPTAAGGRHTRAQTLAFVETEESYDSDEKKPTTDEKGADGGAARPPRLLMRAAPRQPPVPVVRLSRSAKTMEERLRPTIEDAEAARKRAHFTLYYTRLLVNVSLSAQVLLGALVTGISVATDGRTSSIITSVFGAITAICGAYLARVHKANEPAASRARCTALSAFVRDAEAFLLDYGTLSAAKMGKDGTQVAPGATEDELEAAVQAWRTRYDAILAGDAVSQLEVQQTTTGTATSPA